MVGRGWENMIEYDVIGVLVGAFVAVFLFLMWLGMAIQEIGEKTLLY